MEKIGTTAGLCASTAGVWQLVGLLLLIFKVVIPAILIIIGIITLGKAVISDDDKEAKKGFTGLIKKFIVAVMIFFLPTIISALFMGINNFEDVQDDYYICKKCIMNPNGTECKDMVESNNDKDA